MGELLDGCYYYRNSILSSWIDQVSYFVSRLKTEGENVVVFDDFPDEHLFAISTHTPWFVDISNSLDTSGLPQHMPYKEKQRIIRLSANYSWMEGDLYWVGPNIII